MSGSKPPQNFAIQRQQEIMKRINDKGSISIDEIVTSYGISNMTAWRDLKDLEKRGFITKVYGGAVKKAALGHNELGYDERRSKNQAVKEKLAVRAIEEFVRDNQTLFLDGGTTTMEMIPRINRQGVTLITNGLKTLNLASKFVPHLNVISTGGVLREKSLTFVDQIATQAFQKYNADIFFTSGTGLSLKNGITDPGALEMEIKEVMAQKSKRIIALVDSDKFGKDSMVTSLALKDLDVLITDGKAPAKMLEQIKKKGVRVIIV